MRRAVIESSSSTVGIQRVFRRLAKKAADDRMKLLMVIGKGTRRTPERTASLLHIGPSPEEAMAQIQSLQRGSFWQKLPSKAASLQSVLMAAWQEVQPLLPVWGDHFCQVELGDARPLCDPQQTGCTVAALLLMCKNHLPDGGDVSMLARLDEGKVLLELQISGPRMLSWKDDPELATISSVFPDYGLSAVEACGGPVEPSDSSDADNYVPARGTLTMHIPLKAAAVAV